MLRGTGKLLAAGAPFCACFSKGSSYFGNLVACRATSFQPPGPFTHTCSTFIGTMFVAEWYRSTRPLKSAVFPYTRTVVSENSSFSMIDFPDVIALMTSAFVSNCPPECVYCRSSCNSRPSATPSRWINACLKASIAAVTCFSDSAAHKTSDPTNSKRIVFMERTISHYKWR